MSSNKIIPDNDDRGSSRTNIFLCSCIHYAVLRPINRLSHDVRRHITNNSLALRYTIEGEVVAKLNALDCLIVTVVEEFGIRVDIPLRRISDCCVGCGLIVGALDWIAVFFRLFDCTFRPGTSCDIVC